LKKEGILLARPDRRKRVTSKKEKKGFLAKKKRPSPWVGKKKKEVREQKGPAQGVQNDRGNKGVEKKNQCHC